MNRTKIETCEFTWNPITGCRRGCPYCYARRITERFRHLFPNGFEPTLHERRLHEPSQRKTPGLIFVGSMGDTWAPYVNLTWQDLVMEEIVRCDWHTFQVLTQCYEELPGWTFPKHVWAGFTITGQDRLAAALSSLARVRAGVRWVSFEPLLGPIQLPQELPFEWAVVGRMTGSRAIETPREWVGDLVATLVERGIPLFVKNSTIDLVPDPAQCVDLQQWPVGYVPGAHIVSANANGAEASRQGS